MNPVAALDAFLRARQLDTPHIRGLVLALSAGPDSLALLMALAHIAPSLNYRLRAVHIHHGLHADADAWASQALQQARALSVPANVIRVQVSAQASLESAARAARYEALIGDCRADEALLLAHHQDDQAETLMLRLMRGAGLQGLAAMRAESIWRLPDGTARRRWRPWLSVSRQQLMHCLEGTEHSDLSAVHDPANDDPRFARTALRHDILPRLKQHWPGASMQLAQAAEQLAEQAQALDIFADNALAPLLDERTASLDMLALMALPQTVHQSLIARWLSRAQAPSLPKRYWPRVVSELVLARADAQPQLAWAGWSLRRYKQRLYVLHDAELAALPEGIDWPDPQQPLFWAGCEWRLAELFQEPALALLPGLLSRPWRLAARRGGERYRPNAQGPSQSVKHWCQTQNIPPWQRHRVVCVWAGNDVVALKCLS